MCFGLRYKAKHRLNSPTWFDEKNGTLTYSLLGLMDPVDFLILGAGWTSTFLIPQLESASIKHAATTKDGRNSTIAFKFDHSSHDTTPYNELPPAKTVLVTFPLTGKGPSQLITSLYRKVHGDANRWIQLGSTGIFSAPHWNDCNSPYDKTSPRAIAEDEFLALGGCVLNLAGLYGGARNPKNWVTRVAKTKEEVKGKKALHLIHGEDVGRAIIAVHEKFTTGKRWLLTDLRVYDWWDLIQDWGVDIKNISSALAGDELQYAKWVVELMDEENLRALPRNAEILGRVLDSRAFWLEMNLWPSQGRVGGSGSR